MPHILKAIITANATNAKNQFVEALEIAEDARLRPIQMITGPVTTGGKYLITNSGVVAVDSEDEDFFVSDDVLVLYTEGK